MKKVVSQSSRGGRIATANAAALLALCSQSYDPKFSGQTEHNKIVEANASLFTEAFFSEELTGYAVGWKDPNDLDATLEFYAPGVETPRRFEYAQAVNAEEFYSEDDDLRPLRADFGTVEYTETKVNDKTENRGLRIVIDTDQVSNKSNWQQRAVDKLMRRLKRNSLRRAVTALAAAGVNTAKTWDSTAGKDPDGDVIQELVLARDASGISPTRVGYGDTAWAKRVASHRAQTAIGSAASSGFTPQQLAGLLGVEQVGVSKERFSTGGAKSQIVNNLVLMFIALEGADEEDPSNIKRFWSPCDGGEQYRVYVRQIATKLWEVVVEKYEAIRITSTLGIRKFTVA